MKKILTKLTALTLALMMLCPLCVFAGESEIKSDVSFVKWNTYNSHTYSMYYGTKTWEEAQAWCESNGGHLVTITSEDEQNFIEYFNNVFAYLWIGAYRERVIDWEWKWVTGEAWDYTNWAEGEPNNSPNVVPDENCVVLWPMEWNDLSNENVYEQHGFICEWDRTLTEVPTEKPTEESTEKPTEEEYYFDIYIEGGIQIKEGEVYEVYIDTNSPLEVPYTLRSTNEKVFCVRDGYVYAVGGGEAELYIADNYYGMLYSYPVYVYGEDVEEPTEAPTEDKTEEPTEAPTEDGTEENTGEFLGHTYRVYHCSVTWEEAKTWCENNGGHLVTITSADEQQFIERLNESGQNLWIGAYREQRIDWTWSWVTGEVWEYTNWAAGEPNNSPNVVTDE
ncbi:MAG: hypothetical protein IKU60_05980 [Clostridia bacterium]|nr:hypothetical protein [Clostridia bacterium]